VAFRTGMLDIVKRTGGETMINRHPELNQFEQQFDARIRKLFPHHRPVSVDPMRGDPHIADAYLHNAAGAREQISRGLAAIGLEQVPLLVPNSALLCTNKVLSDVTITLARMPLINMSKASWKQILEFRKNPLSVAKLRRLRLFLYDNYSGKSSEYIQDAIQRDIEDYKSCCIEHGFEFKTGVLSTILDSKTLLTTGIITFVAFLFGGPSTGCITATIGSTIEIGKVLLTIADKKHSLAKVKDSHPLAYIIEAADALTKAENEHMGSSESSDS